MMKSRSDHDSAALVMQRQSEDYALFSQRLDETEGDPEAERRWLAELETAAKNLTLNGERFCLAADRLDHEAGYYSAFAEKAHARARLLARWADAARNAVKQAMESAGMTQFDGDAASLRIQASPPRLVLEEGFEPELRFVRVVEETDKPAIKAALAAGEEIPRAHLERGTHLRVRIGARKP